MYTERPSRVPGALVWSAGGDVPARVLPDGCMDLIWDGGALFVAGPDTQAFVPDHTVSPNRTGLRLAPGAAPPLLGVPANALRDRRVALSDLWSRATTDPWVDRLAASASPGDVLEALGESLVRATDDPDPVVEAIAARMRAAAPVHDTAVDLGLSERQLHRRSLDAFGYGPKMLARILRLQRALRLVDRGEPLAQVAATAGYADQPHLARDVKRLAGVPIGKLLR